MLRCLALILDVIASNGLIVMLHHVGGTNGRFPLGIDRHILSGHGLRDGVGSFGAVIRLGDPTSEDIARLLRISRCRHVCSVVCRNSLNRSTTIGLEGDGVLVHLPFTHKVKIPFRHRGGGRCIVPSILPANKGIAGAISTASKARERIATLDQVRLQDFVFPSNNLNVGQGIALHQGICFILLKVSQRVDLFIQLTADIVRQRDGAANTRQFTHVQRPANHIVGTAGHGQVAPVIVQGFSHASLKYHLVRSDGGRSLHHNTGTISFDRTTGDFQGAVLVTDAAISSNDLTARYLDFAEGPDIYAHIHALHRAASKGHLSTIAQDNSSSLRVVRHDFASLGGGAVINGHMSTPEIQRVAVAA